MRLDSFHSLVSLCFSNVKAVNGNYKHESFASLLNRAFLPKCGVGET